MKYFFTKTQKKFTNWIEKKTSTFYQSTNNSRQENSLRFSLFSTIYWKLEFRFPDWRRLNTITVLSLMMNYLNTEEWCEYNVWKYYQVDFIKKTPCHQNDKDEVHDGEDPQGDPLHDGVRRWELVVDHDHGDRNGYQETEQGGHVVLVHSQKISLI